MRWRQLRDPYEKPADDPAGYYEELINDAAKWAVQAVRKDAPQVINRPPGTMELPDDLHLETFNAMNQDPNIIIAKKQELLAQGLSDEEAVQALVEFGEKGLRLAQKGNI